MQVNNIQGPNFGRCTIHKSAYPILETFSNRNITEMFEKAARIQDTKYWDLIIKSRDSKQFYMNFIHKNDPIEYSFCGRLTPCSYENTTVTAIGPDMISSYHATNIYHLDFENEQRAKEIFTALNQPEGKTNMELLDRAVKTIQILEEAFSFQKPKASLPNRILNFLGLKK